MWLCGFSSAAASPDGDITIATVAGTTGDSVTVPITIENNRGIMAITVSITYDSSVLEYVSFTKGDILNDYMVVAHPTKNIIRFVSCETKDRTGDGTLIYLNFNILDGAAEGLYEIDISYSQGDFCNWNLEKLMPSITAGGVRIVKPLTAENMVILRKQLLSGIFDKAFDYNADGNVNIRDLILIKKLSAEGEYYA